MRAIIDILRNDTALVTLLGGVDKIGPNIIGQTIKAPYVVVDLEDEEVTNAFRAPSGVNFERISIFSVADLTFTSGSTVGADEVSKAVKKALNFVAAGTYDGEVITRCTFQRGGKMQEDRISNKPQITKEDEYLLTVRSFSNTFVQLTNQNATAESYVFSVVSDIDLTAQNATAESYPFVEVPDELQLTAQNSTAESYPFLVEGAEIQLTAQNSTAESYTFTVEGAPIQLNVQNATASSHPFTEIPNDIQLTVQDSTAQSHSFTEGIELVHLMIVGQSQAGGFDANPSITTVGDSDVLTLTDGPLDANTSTGELVTVTEGDTYDNGGSSSNVETMATSLGQQLKAFNSGNSNFKYCITVHYHGGSSIQNLDDGGDNQANGHDAAVAASARVKNRADALGYGYQRHFIVSHGGSGVANYTTGATSLIDNLVTNTNVNDSAKPFCWVDQQRVVGTPDFGEQWYDMQTSVTSANLEVLMPRKDVVEYQGDGIHITNHGTRHLAMYYAKAIFDDLFDTPSNPLDIDEANISYANDVITVPVLNSVGTIVGAGDFNIIVFDDTNSNVLGGTWAVNGTDLEFTISSNLPDGETVDIEIQSGFGTGSLRDSRGNTGVIFDDAGASEYTLRKHIVRNTFVKSIAFQVILTVQNATAQSFAFVVEEDETQLTVQTATAQSFAFVEVPLGSGRVLINLGDSNTVSSPDSNSRHWNNITSNSTNKNASTAAFSFASTIVDTDNNDTTLTFTVDDPVDGNFGTESGSNDGGGTSSAVGDYVNPAGLDSWFSNPNSDQVGGEWTIGGLDSGKTYLFKFWGSRAATGTRSVDIATDSVFSDVESYVADNNTDPDQNAELTISSTTSQTFFIRSTSGGSDFGYIGVIDIIEQ